MQRPGEVAVISYTDLGQVLAAAEFAAWKHRDQKRKGHSPKNVPYIQHPLGLANMLTNIGGVEDPAVLVAALLHDTVEDTDTTHEELVTVFGWNVANIVAEVTDDKSQSIGERKRAQIEHAATISTQAKLVKLADKTYNLQDLLFNPPPSWQPWQVRGSFAWSWLVLNQLRGVNDALDKVWQALYERPEVRAMDLDLSVEGLTPVVEEYIQKLTEKSLRTI